MNKKLVPVPKRLTKKQISIYRRWRDAQMVPAIGEIIGGRMLVVDV